jgi:hypothetical protein
MPFLENVFQPVISSASKMISFLNADSTFKGSYNLSSEVTPLYILDSYVVSIEYYMKLRRENALLTAGVSESQTDIYTNNRKSYYEKQYIENTNQMYKIYVFVYMVLYVIYLYLLFVVVNDSSFSKLIVYCLILLFFPFFSNFLSEIIVTLLLYIANQKFMNPYLNIKPENSILGNANAYLI